MGTKATSKKTAAPKKTAATNETEKAGHHAIKIDEDFYCDWVNGYKTGKMHNATTFKSKSLAEKKAEELKLIPEFKGSKISVL